MRFLNNPTIPIDARSEVQKVMESGDKAAIQKCMKQYEKKVAESSKKLREFTGFDPSKDLACIAFHTNTAKLEDLETSKKDKQDILDLLGLQNEIGIQWNNLHTAVHRICGVLLDTKVVTKEEDQKVHELCDAILKNADEIYTLIKSKTI